MRFPGFEGEWVKGELGDIGEVKMCKRIFNEETTASGEIPFYKIGSFGKQADAFITRKKFLEYSQKFSFPKTGNILISAAGTIGRTVIYDGNEAYFQDSNIVWIDNENSIVTDEFLFYILQIVNYNTEGGTIQRLYNSILKSTKLSYPKLIEQNKVSQFLNLIDDRIETQSKIIEGLNAAKSHLLNGIYDQKVRFKDESGTNFSDWKNRRLDKVISKFIVPMRDKPKVLDGDIPWCRIEDFDGRYLSASKTNQGVSEEVVKTMNLKVYPINTLLVSCSANLGFCAITKKELITNQTFIGLVPNMREVNVEYLYYVMKLSAKRLNTLSSGTTISYLSRDQFEKFEVKLPSLLEQNKIAKFLSKMDDKIDVEYQLIHKLKEQKKHLLKNLLI